MHREEEEDIDKDEIYRVLNTTEMTYSTISEEEEEEFTRWMEQRDRVFLHSLKLVLIKEHPIIQVMYSRLVPNTTSDSAFWNHYFFHMEQKGFDFSKYRHESNQPVVLPAVEVPTPAVEMKGGGRCLVE